MSIYVDIKKRFGDFLLDVRFEAGEETVALLGASGCGKSMTLKCIAGIETPDQGKIVVDGVTYFDSEKRVDLSPQERKTGLMFQNYALFPNMTVLQNIRAGAVREKDPARREAAVTSIMERFGLAELAQHYPRQLSGGQQQRVALARILISNPRVLLLDEPFSALDSHLRFLLEQEVRQVIGQFGGTVLLVSHDCDEVFRMSDRVAVMDNGRVETVGTKEEVFAAPKTRHAAMLTGCKNISRVKMVDKNHVYALEWGVSLAVTKPLDKIGAIGIRMHDIRPGEGENTLKCAVIEEVENPFSFTVMLRPQGVQNSALIGWELDKESWKRLQAPEVQASLPPESILLLEE